MAEKVKAKYDLTDTIGISKKFASLNRLITRDLNNNRTSPTFTRYSKDEIQKWLSDPYRYEKQLRDAVTYIYGASPHFRRIIQYFTMLTDLAYVVSPYRIDPRKANKRTTNINYRRVLNTLSIMSIKTQFPKIITVCLRDDVFYGTFLVTSDNITVMQLPTDFCSISEIEGNVINVTFNFQYFDSRKDMLEYYPQEFKTKYELYRKDRRHNWIELDSPASFCVKVNTDILTHAIPPFAGILRDLYDLEDYRQLKLDKTELENYAMLAMTLPLNDDGDWGIDLVKAKEFWRNLDSVLPDEVGSVLTPMPINKISFEKSNVGDTDTITDCENNIFTAAGVSSLLFNNPKASANALLLSIKADQGLTFGIVKSLEDVVNRFIQSFSYGKNFKVTMLDVSPFNRDEMAAQYLKACQYGMPMISNYAATVGLGQAELDCMNYLETEVLELPKYFIPLQSSAQMGSDESGAPTDEGGRPPDDIDELTDSGEQTREDM